MIKDMMSEGPNSIANIENKLVQALDVVRGEVDSSDWYFLLFLLTLQREGLLEGFSKHKEDELKKLIRVSVEKLEDENSYALKIIFESFEPIINRISDRAINNIIRLLGTLDQTALEKDFSDIFDDLLYKISKSQGRYSGQYIQPLELSRFVCGLADLHENARVYNPFAGLASFGVFLDEGQNYLGQEINQTTWAIGSLRLLAYERKGISEFILGDSINSWNPSGDKYDLIVANPPFNVKGFSSQSKRFGTIRSYEHFLIEKGVEDLKINGKLIVVISQGILFRSGVEQNLRKFLVENDLLEMVISFPKGLLMNTGIPIAIIVINKDKAKKGYVRLIDAKKYVDNTKSREKRLNDYALNSATRSQIESDSIRIVTNDTISSLDYNLNVPRYFQKQIDGVILGDLVSLVPFQRNQENHKGRFIRIRDLREEKFEYNLKYTEVENTEIPRAAQRISESCLLLATRWKTLKPTYFEYEGESIHVFPDTIAVKVDETKIDRDYLVNELHADYVTEQLESYRIGDTVPYIRKDDLLNIKIQVPSLLEQKAKIKGAKETLAKEKERELELFKKINGLESEILEQNAHLRHSLAGPSSNLKGSFSNIKSIISEKILPIVPDIMNFKVSEKHELTFGQYFEIIDRDIEKITNAVTRRLKVDTEIESKELTNIEIADFLQGFVNEYLEKKDLKFTIVFEIDEEAFLDSEGKITKTFIKGNVDLLTDLLNNLIDNAVAHAFSGGGKQRVEIFLMKSTEEENINEIQILFSNTGKPFPENFLYADFIRKGSKSGINSGDGYGGWYINEIIKKLNGSFDIIDETGPEGLNETELVTSFEINFPIIETEKDEEV